MLTLLAYSMVIVFMFLIMTKRLSALIALILVPIVFALLGGFGAEIGPMMLDGIKKLAPTGVMLMFAILYFAVMIDAGLFDPVVRQILKLVNGDPMKVVVGTAVLALFVSLDGDGSTTYMITVAAMLPLYKRLRHQPPRPGLRDHARRRRDEHPAVGRPDRPRGERAAASTSGRSLCPMIPPMACRRCGWCSSPTSRQARAQAARGALTCAAATTAIAKQRFTAGDPASPGRS